MTPDRSAFVAAVLITFLVSAHAIRFWFARRVRRANTPSARVVELLAESHHGLHRTIDALVEAVAEDLDRERAGGSR